jgi:hypothetical protein
MRIGSGDPIKKDCDEETDAVEIQSGPRPGPEETVVLISARIIVRPNSVPKKTVRSDGIRSVRILRESNVLTGADGNSNWPADDVPTLTDSSPDSTGSYMKFLFLFCVQYGALRL